MSDYIYEKYEKCLPIIYDMTFYDTDWYKSLSYDMQTSYKDWRNSQIESVKTDKERAQEEAWRKELQASEDYGHDMVGDELEPDVKGDELEELTHST